MSASASDANTTRIVDASSSKSAKKLDVKSDQNVDLSKQEMTDHVDQMLNRADTKLIDTEINDDQPEGPVGDPSSLYDQPASSVDEMNSAHAAVGSIVVTRLQLIQIWQDMATPPPIPQSRLGQAVNIFIPRFLGISNCERRVPAKRKLRPKGPFRPKENY